MPSASSMFSADDRKRVAQAVAEAEAGTTAEIVPIVAADSGRYDRAEDVIGLLCGVVVMAGAWLAIQREDPAAGGWSGLRLTLDLPALLILLLAGFLAGTAIAMRVAPLRRLFTARREMREEVARRATQLFFDRRIYSTPHASGVLVYVSLFERRAAVLADDAVFKALGQSAINELCATLSADLRRGSTADALCTTIGVAGARLREKLPAGAPKEPGEGFRDALVTID